MACDLVGGYAKTCASERGGIKSVTFIQSEFATYTLDADNQVTAITITSGNRGWKYDLEINLSSFTDTLTRSRDNGTLFAAQSLSMILNDNRIATRNNLVLMAQNDLMAIVELANGDYEMLGADNGLTFETDERATGVVKGDRNGHTINLVGSEKELGYKVDSSIIAAILIPTS